MEKSIHRDSSVPSLKGYWIDSDPSFKLNIGLNSVYEPMAQLSEISTGVFKPNRDCCKKCGNAYLVHFFITCSCTASFCCSCIAQINNCTSCQQFLGATCLFTKSQMFNKTISMHECMFQRNQETTTYSQSLKNLMYTDSVYIYKEISALLDIFTEIRLNEENSNFIFYKINNQLNLVKESLLIHYDKLFSDSLHKTLHKVKMNVNYISNVTKINHFKNEKDFGENINIFLKQGQDSSERKKKIVNKTRKYDRKILYIKFLFTIVLVTVLLLIVKLCK
jgi:hypothetical protein